MERGNVLVIGNSGVGKSTLINAVLGEEIAETGWGTMGTTKELKIYENDRVPFRIIDSVGFEPALLKEFRAVNAVKKWSRNCAKEGKEDNQINVIWFCVEGTSSKLFEKNIRNVSHAVSMWKSVPVIVVITKSYSVPEREQNIRMVREAFAKQKKGAGNVQKIIPVVASTYIINESAYAPPEGITELIDATNLLMPEGIKAGEKDLAAYKISRKKALAQGIVGTATTAGVVVGAVPIPFADAMILSPIEVAEINSLARLYGIKKDADSKKFLNAMVEAGTVSAAARAAISGIKMIPGLNLGVGVLNAIVAGSIVAAIGEGAVLAFEQVMVGKKSVTDVEWGAQMIESKLSSQFLENVKKVAEKNSDKSDKDKITKSILDIFKNESDK